MAGIERLRLLGVRIAATDYDTAVDRIIESALARSSLAVSALAVHGVMTGAMDSTHRFRLNALDLCVPDGQPVRWALNWRYSAGLRDRVYGPELMLRLCERASSEGVSIYLYGSSREVLDQLTANLRRRFPRLTIAGTSPSRFKTISLEERETVVRQIRESGASLVFCGLGCPRQEVWAYEYRDALGIPIVAVGAAFDFFAGTASQAPRLLQRYGLEWAYRLSKEPGRLWRRYLVLNPLYLAYLAAESLRLKAFSFPGTQPGSDIGFG
jgi:exopolysaccharide biosynthesis WecB/TagA/CpsF family protein